MLTVGLLGVAYEFGEGLIHQSGGHIVWGAVLLIVAFTGYYGLRHLSSRY
jgi:hypothetical protein